MGENNQSKLNCVRCRFFEVQTETGGQCRRHSQQVVTWTDRDFEGRSIYSSVFDWPQVSTDQWCGEWESVRYPNGQELFSPNGMMLDQDGNRSIFDDVDEGRDDMTLAPRRLGDKGQRYQLECFGYPEEGWNVIGWSDQLETSKARCTALLLAPTAKKCRILDRDVHPEVVHEEGKES